MRPASDLTEAELSAENEGGTSEILTFRIGTETFGIRVMHVREVLDHKPIARVSNAPPTLLGMIDVRGIGVPVVDLKLKLRMAAGGEGEGEPTPDSRIVVLEFDAAGRHQTVAIVADAVYEVSDLGDAALERPPQFGESWNSAFMTGLGRRGESFLTLLDIPHLFETAADLAA
ncbi:chemotaxis protein CheW [Aureimonas endophytica]|uniref:Chemotaxis protein CheW n=1 Tax=Aureimonas endophytica TaxID=2027858 RepID=A0A917A3R7_9HYPH|nr:chemotaxis protein CheW [Aureimonas endophytica]GGE25301.1 chemotaxis protein CheW [Aureimonas endophytica]